MIKDCCGVIAMQFGFFWMAELMPLYLISQQPLVFLWNDVVDVEALLFHLLSHTNTAAKLHFPPFTSR